MVTPKALHGQAEKLSMVTPKAQHGHAGKLSLAIQENGAYAHKEIIVI